MAEDTLPPNEIQSLRDQGILTENEIVLRQGDLLVAVDVLTQERRIITRLLPEGIPSKRLLKG